MTVALAAAALCAGWPTRAWHSTQVERASAAGACWCWWQVVQACVSELCCPPWTLEMS
jgi:hypothetical protein